MFLPAPVPAEGTGGAALPGALTEPRPRRAHCDSARARPGPAPAAPPPANGHSAAAPANQRARLCPPSLVIARWSPPGIAHWLLPAPGMPLAPPRCLPQLPGSSSERVGPAPFLHLPPPIGCEERPVRAAIGGGGGAATLKRGCGRAAGLEAVRARLVLAELPAPFPSFKHHEGSERAIYPQIPHEGLRTLRLPRPRGHCLAVRDEERSRSCRRGAEGSLGPPCLVYTSPHSKCCETLLNLKSLIPHLSLQRVTR